MKKMRKPRKIRERIVPKWELVLDPVLDLALDRKTEPFWSRNNL